MARCEVCFKKRRFGRLVSHSGIRTPRLFKPNLHTAWVIEDGVRVRMKLCTKCLRKVRKEQEELKKKVEAKKAKIGVTKAKEKIAPEKTSTSQSV